MGQLFIFTRRPTTVGCAIRPNKWLMTSPCWWWISPCRPRHNCTGRKYRETMVKKYVNMLQKPTFCVSKCCTFWKWTAFMRWFCCCFFFTFWCQEQFESEEGFDGCRLFNEESETTEGWASWNLMESAEDEKRAYAKMVISEFPRHMAHAHIINLLVKNADFPQISWVVGQRTRLFCPLEHFESWHTALSWQWGHQPFGNIHSYPLIWLFFSRMSTQQAWRYVEILDRANICQQSKKDFMASTDEHVALVIFNGQSDPKIVDWQPAILSYRRSSFSWRGYVTACWPLAAHLMIW